MKKRVAAPTGCLGFALVIWLVGGGLSVTPASAQVCVGTVDPPAGKVCGLAVEAPAKTGRALYSYRGIPYALPPVAALRWARPEPHPRWHDLRHATSFGAVCPQDGVTTSDSEDCLFLNIWTPRAAVDQDQRRLLPVMVFIHGGYFVFGAGSLPVYKGPNGTARPKPYLVGVNRDEGALFADLANQGIGGISQSAYQDLLDISFGTSGANSIVGFTAGGGRPYDPADQGTLPPWFANSPQAAAVSTLINDFVFRCGNFLAADNVVETSDARPVYAYLFAQAPIYESDGSTACAPFPAEPGIQNACHSFELPYVFNTLSSTNAALIPQANSRLARRIARHWTHFARTLEPGGDWQPYRANSPSIGNNIEILSTGRAATGALPVPDDPLAASNCAALWATQPPFSGNFPAPLSAGP